MKTTVSIPDEIYTELKVKLLREGKTLSSWVTGHASKLVKKFETEDASPSSVFSGTNSPSSSIAKETTKYPPSEKDTPEEWDNRTSISQMAHPERKP